MSRLHLGRNAPEARRALAALSRSATMDHRLAELVKVRVSQMNRCAYCVDLPLDVFFTASSCVPAYRFESPRRPFTPGDLEGLLRRKRVVGLAEGASLLPGLHDTPRAGMVVVDPRR